MGDTTYADAQNPPSPYSGKNSRNDANSEPGSGSATPVPSSRLNRASAVSQAKTLLQRFSGHTRPGAWHPSLDRQKVAKRLSDLVENPDGLNQGANGLCGEAAFFNVWLWEDPLAVTRFGVQLYTGGAAAVGTEEWVRPRKALRDQNFTNVAAQFKQSNPKEFALADQWGADWMLMSSLRDANNRIISYDGTPTDKWGAGSTDHEMVNWLEATQLFSSVSSSASRQAHNFASAAALNPRTDILILSIDSHMLGNPENKPPEDDHDIVLRSAIIEGTNATVDFQYWSWGEPTQWINDRRTKTVQPPLPDLLKAQFTDEFFGDVVARR